MDVHNPRTPIWRGLKAVDWLGSLALLAVTLMTLLGFNFGGESSDFRLEITKSHFYDMRRPRSLHSLLSRGSEIRRISCHAVKRLQERF